ncbi:transposase [Streptomyces sp. NBC_00829]|uniref:transposase n=1 Tax=Streptomyces sp. NBC_00829 TaxID=2903679 RepID=UPI00386BC530|nr:transposase [Streptomyces sp. NBC_00829]
MRDHLGGLWRDEDFADWYPRDGRPGLSPAPLATVCVLQFLLGLSDRQAAEAVRCRIDFKYALAMELDAPGFHHSVLADFRDRLTEGGRADRLLDLALARLKEAGLVRERTTQRTDSTHVLAAVRDLTRLELVTEAVRAALEELASAAPHLLADLVDEEWGRRYGRPVRLGKNPTRPRPGSLPQAATPSGCWSSSESMGRIACPVPGSRPCGRSWCRTTTATGPAVCAGAPPRTAGCRPRPSQSSRPTIRRPAMRAADMSPVGRGSSRISPRPVIPTTSM